MDFYQQSNYPAYNPIQTMGTQLMQPSYPNAYFVNVLDNCAAECFSTMSQLAGRPDREIQIKLLHDCARICESQVTFTVVGSIFSKQHAAFCAIICETCGYECAKFPDPMSQHCSRVCLHCAEMCKRYAAV